MCFERNDPQNSPIYLQFESDEEEEIEERVVVELFRKLTVPQGERFLFVDTYTIGNDATLLAIGFRVDTSNNYQIYISGEQWSQPIIVPITLEDTPVFNFGIGESTNCDMIDGKALVELVGAFLSDMLNNNTDEHVEKLYSFVDSLYILLKIDPLAFIQQIFQ